MSRKPTTTIKRPPSTFGMRLRGDEWQVHHGNRIVARYTNELEAENHLRSILKRPLIVVEAEQGK